MNYEKVSVNIDSKALAQMDLLVENGFYGNRSDFITEAVGLLLDKNTKTIDGLLEAQSLDEVIENDNVWFIGVCGINKESLERVKKHEKKISIKGFGVLSFSKDCDVDLIHETIESIAKGIRINGPKGISEFYRPKK